MAKNLNLVNYTAKLVVDCIFNRSRKNVFLFLVIKSFTVKLHVNEFTLFL